MPNSSFNITGEKRRFHKLFGSRSNINKLWKVIKNKGLLRMALFLEGKIKKNIYSSGSLAGQPFQANSELTISIKKSSKPLINTGDFMGSIHGKVINEELAFVGVKRGETGSSGGDLSDIAEVNEYGAITKNGFQIPARPSIGPVKEKFGKDAFKQFGKAVEEGLS